MSNRNELAPEVRQLQERVKALEQRNSRLQRSLVELLVLVSTEREPEEWDGAPIEQSDIEDFQSLVGEDTALARTLERAVTQTEGLALQTHDTEGERGTGGGHQDATEGESDDRTPLDDDYQL